MKAAVSCTVMRAKKVQRGFTFVEIMVVVAIIGVLMAGAASVFSRAATRTDVAGATADMKSRIERVRGFAAEAGSLWGTPNLQGPTCPGFNVASAPFPITVNPGGDYWVPSSYIYDGATQIGTVFCENIQIINVSDGNAAFSPLTPAATFSFTPSGRIVDAAGAPLPTGVFVQLQNPTDVLQTYGFRVLPSGMLCSSSDPAGALATMCDEDPS